MCALFVDDSKKFYLLLLSLAWFIAVFVYSFCNYLFFLLFFLVQLHVTATFVVSVIIRFCCFSHPGLLLLLQLTIVVAVWSAHKLKPTPSLHFVPVSVRFIYSFVSFVSFYLCDRRHLKCSFTQNGSSAYKHANLRFNIKVYLARDDRMCNSDGEYKVGWK